MEVLDEMLRELSRVGRVSTRDNMVIVEVGADKLREAASLLVKHGFDHVASLTVVDLVKEGRFRIDYVAESYDNPLRIVVLRTFVPRNEPKVPSLIDIWPSVELQERENWEMFGIVFEGHPDLRHLLLPDDWPPGTYPLRKDFVVREEPIMAPPELQKRAEEVARRAGLGSEAGGQQQQAHGH